MTVVLVLAATNFFMSKDDSMWAILSNVIQPFVHGSLCYNHIFVGHNHILLSLQKLRVVLE